MEVEPSKLGYNLAINRVHKLLTTLIPADIFMNLKCF